VSNLLAGALGVLLATNQPAAVSNVVVKQNGVTVAVPDLNDPVEKEFQKLLADDDAAQAEVDQWIKGNQKFAAEGAAASNADLNQRIRKRFEPVRQAYEDFLRQHPKHVRARVGYASFLGDIGDEEGSRDQLEKARELDPKDPAIWNNLANYYGHRGPVTNAFAYYTKAIELDPNEPVYYHNFGTTVFLFRVDAREYYHITEQSVFDKALELYDHALKLSPNDFPLASDVAQTYYGIKPPRTEEALRAWTNAFALAHDDIEREGVQVHFARVKTHAGRFAEAHAHLDAITNAMYAELKGRLVRTLKDKEAAASGTNAPPSDANGKP
jgi:tetratricopeptide (TPR) repeat protein